ncbi:MAG: DEAD/DEAH box helicase family protein [Candidatus Paceibacterota bacterium]
MATPSESLILYGKKTGNHVYLYVPSGKAYKEENLEKYTKDTCGSWKGAFSFLEETDSIPGLRSPQIGAIHSVLGHWRSKEDLATVVMPTGTGKTEVMISLLVKEQMKKLLVVVPSNDLREQTATKFAKLGILKNNPLEVIDKSAMNPTVGVLKGRLKDKKEAEEFLKKCNVVVASMSALNTLTYDIKKVFLNNFDHLFIDEAHHTGAKTWNDFRNIFVESGINTVQFTATPFRRDGKHIGGRFVFSYPVKKAQEEKYFKHINFKPVVEHNELKEDESVAKVAVAQLREDIDSGLDHLMMARTENKDRAKDVLKVYKKLAPELNPELIHSGLSAAKKKQIKSDLEDHKIKIIVCVNMLGEGYDLPELKIAALHDVHKSLAVALQFIGRFTRTSSAKIGDATVVANIVNVNVDKAMKDLYSQDPDWNKIISQLSEKEALHSEDVAEFIQGFNKDSKSVVLQNIRPKMSTVVFRTKCSKWSPGVIEKLYDGQLYDKPLVSEKDKTIVFILKSESTLNWSSSKDMKEISYHLYVVYWNEDQKLLFINSTNNNSLHFPLAKGLCDSEDIVNGLTPYRSMHGVKRLMLTNMGLRSAYDQNVRFRMYVGSDLEEAITDALSGGKIKTNIFGIGFENGDKTSIGCSYKGRIWSYWVADSVLTWKKWCIQISKKLLDDSIDIDQILGNAMFPRPVTSRPNIVPLAVEWSEEILFGYGDTKISFWISGEKVPLGDIDLAITDFSTTDPITFALKYGSKKYEYRIPFKGNSVSYEKYLHKENIEVQIGGTRTPIEKWFKDQPPVIRFADNSFLIFNLHFTERNPQQGNFALKKIDGRKWPSSVDVSKESKIKYSSGNAEYVNESIQAHVIDQLKKKDYDIVFNDDGSGEVADVICLKANPDEIVVTLVHIKYSSKKPGSRVGDLYELCGQVQKSIMWKKKFGHMIDHMVRRSENTKDQYSVARIEKGDTDLLFEIKNKHHFNRIRLEVLAVQPGLSKSKITKPALDLLGATEVYLKETLDVDFNVIGSQ